MLTEVPPLFLACCDPDSIRYDIKKPFVRDGYVWATDARICVRQPTDDFDPSLLASLMADRGKLPTAETMWTINAKGERPHRYSLPETEWRVTCPECNGGDEWCEYCENTRWVHTCDPVPFGDLFIISWLVGLLRHHGVTEIIAGKHNKPIMFSLGRIEGMMMPMDKTRVLENMTRAAQYAYRNP